jgi:hypothetical protein
VQMDAIRTPARPASFERRNNSAGWWAPIVLVARHDDGVRLRDSFKSGGQTEGEPGAGRHRLLRVGAHGRLVPGVGAGVEDLRRDSQIDGVHTVDRDPVCTQAWRAAP